MRYSKEHKVETHARIVKKASVRLREKGAHGIGVADLMKEAGLTHGGFYSHFESREALVIEAFTFAMNRSIENWRKVADEKPPAQRLETVISKYLTPLHRDAPGRGCALPSLGADIARESPKTRKAFAAKLDGMIELLAENFAESSPKTARTQAMALLSTMVGSLLMARIAGTGEMSDAILSAGRDAALAMGQASVGAKRIAKTSALKSPRKSRSAASLSV